jgi:hypothetical protein
MLISDNTLLRTWIHPRVACFILPATLFGRRKGVGTTSLPEPRPRKPKEPDTPQCVRQAEVRRRRACKDNGTTRPSASQRRLLGADRCQQGRLPLSSLQEAGASRGGVVSDPAGEIEPSDEWIDHFLRTACAHPLEGARAEARRQGPGLHRQSACRPPVVFPRPSPSH